VIHSYRSVIKSIGRFPKPWILLFSILLTLVVGVADDFTGPNVSIHLFYLIPISLATWFAGKWAGVVVASESELVAFLANVVLSTHHPIPAWAYWNSGMGLGVLIIFTLILSAFQGMLDSLEQEQFRSQQLAGRIINAQEEERKRVARELHDEAGQALTALSLRIEQIKLLNTQSKNLVCAEDFDRLKGLTTQILSEIRRLAFNLRPALLEDLGLNHSLSTLFREQLRKRGIKVAFRSNQPELRVTSEIELALFRITQEAVANIVKYANASEVTARLDSSQNRLELEISDNGDGFDTHLLNDRKNFHLGIAGMMERAFILSGEFNLHSVPGEGTTVSLSIPLPPQAGKEIAIDGGSDSSGTDNAKEVDTL